MPVDVKSQDAEAIRRLIPVSTLSVERFKELCDQINIEEGPIGTVLFRQGDNKKDFVYLLQGSVTLHAGGMEMDTIQGGSEASRFAVAHQLPRKVNAVASSKIRYLRVSADFFNRGPIRERKNDSYEVSDIPETSSDDWMTSLLRSPLFQRLPASNLQRLLMALESVEYEAGQTILHQGDPGDFYYIIKEGRVALSRKPTANAKEIKLCELRNCDTFGEDSLLSGAPRNVTVTAATDCTLLRLDKEHFLTLVKDPVLRVTDFETATAEVQAGAVFLDIRTNDEFERRHIDGSINIPFFSMRLQLSNLERGKKYIVVCEDGRASGAAVFLLIRNGFDADVLEGGINQALHLDSDDGETAQTPLIDPAFPDAELEEEYDSDDKPALERHARRKAEQAVQLLKRELEEKILQIRSMEQAQAGEDRTTALQKEIESLRQELANARKISESAKDVAGETLEKLKVELKSTREVLGRREDELNATTAKLAGLQRDRDDLRRQTQTFDTQLKQIQALLEEKREALAQAVADKETLAFKLQSAQDEQGVRTRRLEQTLQQKRAQAEKAEHAMLALQDELHRAREALKLARQQQRESAQQQAEQAAAMLKEKQALEKAAATGGQARLAEMEELRTELAEAKKTVEEEKIRYGELLTEKDAETERLAEERKKLQDAQHSLELEMERLREGKSELEQVYRNESETKLAERAAREEELQNSLKATSDANAQLAGRLEEIELRHRTESEQWLRDRTQLKEQLAALADERKSLSEQLESRTDVLKQEADKRRRTLQSELETRNQALAEMKRERDAQREAAVRLEERLATLTAERETLLEEQEVYAELNDELEEKLKVALGRESDLNRQIAVLNEQAEKHSASIDAIAELEQSKSRLAAELKERTEALRALETRYAEQVDASRSQIEDLETRLARSQTTHQDLSGDRKRLEASLEQAVDEARKLRQQVETLKQKADAERKETDEQLASLQQRFDDVLKEKESLDEQLKQQNETLETLEKIHAEALTAHRTETDSLQAALAEAETVRRSTVTERENLRVALNEALDSKTSLAGQIEALKKQSSAEQSEIAAKLAALEKETTDTSRENKELRAALEDEKGKHSSQQTELQTLQERCRDLEAQLKTTGVDGERAAELQTRLDTASRGLDDEKTRSEGYRKEIKALRQKLDAASAENEAHREKQQRLEATLADMSGQDEERKQLEELLEKTVHERETLKNQLKDLDGEIERLAKHNQILQQDVDSLEELKARAETNAQPPATEEDLQLDEQGNSKRLSELESRIEDLKNQLATVNRDNNDLYDQLLAKEEEHQRLVVEFAKMREAQAGGPEGAAYFEEKFAELEQAKDHFKSQAETLTEELHKLKESAHKTAAEQKRKFETEMAVALKQKSEKIRAQNRAELETMTEKLARAERTAAELMNELQQMKVQSPTRQGGSAVTPGLAAVDLDVFALAETSGDRSNQRSAANKRTPPWKQAIYAAAASLGTLALAGGLAFGTEPGREMVKMIISQTEAPATSKTDV